MKFLVGVHLALSVAPMAILVVREVEASPVTWLFGSLSLAQIMLVAFWAGLGTSRPLVRLLWALTGGAYLAIWSALWMTLTAPDGREVSFFALYPFALAAFCMGILALAGIFLIFRRWVVRLRRIEDPAMFDIQHRPQYSWMSWIALATFATGILAMTLVGRIRNNALADLARDVAPIVDLLAMAFAAPWATLSGGKAARRIAMVLALGLVLAILQLIGRRYVGSLVLPWQIYASDLLMIVLPALIMIASLLVVRSCGYRLVSVGRTVPTTP
jgi:hypothetical protein